MSFAYQLIGFTLVLLGIMLLAVFLMRLLDRGDVRGRGFSVILMGPFPLILKDGVRVVVIPLILFAVVLLLILFLNL